MKNYTVHTVLTAIFLIIFGLTAHAAGYAKNDTIIQISYCDTAHYGDASFGLAQALLKTAEFHPENFEAFVEANPGKVSIVEKGNTRDIILQVTALPCNPTNLKFVAKDFTSVELLTALIHYDFMFDYGNVIFSVTDHINVELPVVDPAVALADH